MDNVVESYDEAEMTDAHQGDIVMYFDDQGNYQHVGIAEGNNKVRSRFGIAHVYEHPIETVPTYYGDTIRVFRKPQS